MTEGEIHDRFLKAKNRHSLRGEFIDYKTSMITGADPLRGLFYYDLGFSHTLHVLQERRRRCKHYDLS